jgi:pSer/pThr/pTyr-binding forkhead associated (FHA) protein
MEVRNNAAGGAGPGDPGARPQTMPANFVPLRLVLQESGVTVELTRPDMLLGRHSEADIRLPLPDVSRRHCRFVFTDGCWHVHDLKSLNGTFLNDEAVEHALVCHGDTVRVGGFTFEADLSNTAQSGEVLRASEGVLLSISRALPKPESDPNERRAS